MPEANRGLFFANLAKAEAAREAEVEKHFAERALWGTDRFPPTWTREQKQEAALHPARVMAATQMRELGQLTPQQAGLYLVELENKRKGSLDGSDAMREHLADTNRGRYSQDGAVFEAARWEECPLDNFRKQARLESTGYPERDKQIVDETQQLVDAWMGYNLHKAGHIDHKGLGKLVEQAGAVPKDQRDPDDGSLLVTHEELGVDTDIYFSDREQNPTRSTIFHAEQAEREKEKIKTDPLAAEKARIAAEMKISDDAVSDFARRQTERRFGDHPRGRKQLAEHLAAEKRAAAREAEEAKAAADAVPANANPQIVQQTQGGDSNG